MKNNKSIIVSDLSKCFQIYDKPQDRLKQMFMPKHKYLYKEFWALNKLSFSLEKGETLGIVGKNGSGKSTLLQIIAGTLTPTAGHVETHGRIAALLELGSGFNSDFTGRENVFMNAALLGLSHSEIDQRFDSIASFADIGDFINQPVKTYSSGMLVRLAFAVQAQIDPDILIVDEALAVGDAKFQAKCFERLKRLKDNGTSILLVTHSSEQVVTHCSQAIFMNDGNLVSKGKPKDIVNLYLDHLFGRKNTSDISEKNIHNNKKIDQEYLISDINFKNKTLQTKNIKLNTSIDNFHTRPLYNKYEYRWGDKRAIITDFLVYNEESNYPQTLNNSDSLFLIFSVKTNGDLFRPIFGVTIKNKDGVTIFGSNSELLSCSVNPNKKEYLVEVRLDCVLGDGDYFISLGVASSEGSEIIPHDRRYDSIHFSVKTKSVFFGLTNMNMKMDIQ